MHEIKELMLLKNQPAGPRFPFRNERSGNETWIEGNLLEITKKKCIGQEWRRKDQQNAVFANEEDWSELNLGKGRVEESEGRKESSTAESGE